MLIEPLFDRVVLKELKQDLKKTTSGLVLPETNQEKPFISSFSQRKPSKSRHAST